MFHICSCFPAILRNKPMTQPPGLSEEEEIEKAVALSLLTAQEDDKRRRDRYGAPPADRSTVPSPVPTTTMASGTSLISRPRPSATARPRAGGTGVTTTQAAQIPTVPPRPDSKVLEEKRASHAHMHSAAPLKPPPPHGRTGWRTSSGSTLPPPSRPPPPDHPRRSLPEAPPPGDTPLITLSPDPKSQPTKHKDALEFDFDLDSLDPLNNSNNAANTHSPAIATSNKALFTPTTASGFSSTSSTGSVLSNIRKSTESFNPWGQTPAVSQGQMSTFQTGSRPGSAVSSPIGQPQWDSATSFAIFDDGKPKNAQQTSNATWAAFNDCAASKTSVSRTTSVQVTQTSAKLPASRTMSTGVPSNPFRASPTNLANTNQQQANRPFPNYYVSSGGVGTTPAAQKGPVAGGVGTSPGVLTGQVAGGFTPGQFGASYGASFGTNFNANTGASVNGLPVVGGLRRVPSDHSLHDKGAGLPYALNPTTAALGTYALNPTTAALDLPMALARVPSDGSIVSSLQNAPVPVQDASYMSLRGLVKDCVHSNSQPNMQALEVSMDIRLIDQEPGDNLMSFPIEHKLIDNEELLSLASFDPLYSLDEEKTESQPPGGLIFTNQYDRFQRKETMNPFPCVTPVTTQQILEKIKGGRNSPQQASEAGAKAELPDGDPEAKGHKRNISSASSGSTGEIQDPFSVSDLEKLEKKRRTHVEEQEKRKALLRNKNKGTDSPARNRNRKEGFTGQEVGGEKLCGVEEEEVQSSAGGGAKRLSRTLSHIAKGRESVYEVLQQYNEAAQDEVKAFCDVVARLKLQYPSTHESNHGLIISPRLEHPAYIDMTVKVTVTARFMTEPMVFTPSLTVSVQHMICEVLLSLTEDMHSTSTDDYLFKVFGRSEYLLNESTVGEYEYIQNCLRLDEDIKLVMMEYPKVERPLLRTVVDDKQPVLVPKHKNLEETGLQVTRDMLNILMETFYKEVEKLRDLAIQAGCAGVQCKGVIQAVKAICAVLYKMETIDIIKAIKKLCAVTVHLEPGLVASNPANRESFLYVTPDGEGHVTVIDSADQRVSESVTSLDDLHISLDELTKAVKGQIDLFCRTFHTDFRFGSATALKKEKREVSSLDETLLINIATAHRVPLKWKNMFESFKVRCGLYYGGKKLCDELITSTKPYLADGLQDTLVWDEWLHFPSLFLRRLPREARLVLELIGVKVTQGSGSEGAGVRVNTPLGWAACQVYNHKFELVQGSQLLGLWHNENTNPVGTTMSATEFTSCVLLQLNVPDFDCEYTFPAVLDPLPNCNRDFSTLHPNDQDQLTALCARTPNSRLAPDVSAYLWEKRNHLHASPAALPPVLTAAPSWESGQLQKIYTAVQDWSPLEPTQALQLLLPQFPDTFVRTKAVEWLSALTDDQIIDLLPQLIQALKFECYHTSALAKLLIERSILNPRFAHLLYWLLKEAADDIHFRKRYQLVFGALLSVVGEAGRRQFGKEEDLVKMLAAIAEKVKVAKDRENVLQREVFNMWEFLEHSTVRLPINPAMIVYGLDCKSCSYFSSNAFPLRLVFKNIEPRAESIYTMFKSGDDLRQDMLTMQIIRIMDRLWRAEQLDLKIITFKCQATGVRKGLVELVTECDTLRKIQVKHGRGVTGSFRDSTIREWLQLHNPTELEFQKAVDNFIASCAGYCVATYVLGICDRHNDNIMVKQSGHLFHIDFGKFLGDAQMFGNIKRDRTPFVLTSDMAYVINGGDKPSYKFQTFIDLCCTAFNIIRKHATFFSNLFSLMVESGIPGVNHQATKYVERALLPEQTDTEATAVFTRFIEESLKSTFTQWNFFIHNLAQMKFSGHAEGALLSFIPKTYSIHTDGAITNVEIFGYQKRYNPEKYYVYIIKVDRENQKVSSFIFRRFSEFQELAQKLDSQFPLIKLPGLSNKVVLGRTHVKTVAEERKHELQGFLKALLLLSAEIAQHDLVYTFFHSMLRDEQDIDKTNIDKLKEPSPPRVHTRQIGGEIKLSVFYKNDELTVMVIHVRNLAGCGGDPPDPYVKLYLLPDPFKETKRKTKVIKATFHPTYNEMIVYHLSMAEVSQRTLSASVWSYDALSENEYLGSCRLKLGEIDWARENTAWWPLRTHPS